MAANISKKRTINIKGILSIEENKQILVEVEDVETPMNLADIVAELSNQKVTISFAQSEDIA